MVCALVGLAGPTVSVRSCWVLPVENLTAAYELSLFPYTFAQLNQPAWMHSTPGRSKYVLEEMGFSSLHTSFGLATRHSSPRLGAGRRGVSQHATANLDSVNLPSKSAGNLL